MKKDMRVSEAAETAYSALEKESRRKLFAIQQRYYSYIDLDDMEAWNGFAHDYLVLDYLRDKAGVHPLGVTGMPDLEICDYLRDDFVAAINRKFEEKQAQLAKLGG